MGLGSVLLNYFFGTMIMTVLEQERMMKLVMFMLSITLQEIMVLLYSTPMFIWGAIRQVGNVSNLWVLSNDIFKSLIINN